MSLIKERYDPNPAFVRFEPTEFAHSFGGAPRHRGVVPSGQTVPMHLMLNLDLSDPLTPVEPVEGGPRFLPLYYPLRYGGGGGEVQYSVDSDSQITILSPLEELGTDDGSDYPYPDQFPERPVRLMPMSYKQLRALAASECGTNHHFDDPDKKADFEILKEMGYWSMIRLGGGFSPIQGDIKWACQNNACEWKGKHVRVDVFASLKGDLPDQMSVWGMYGSYVEIYFCLMSCCQTITTVNRCT